MAVEIDLDLNAGDAMSKAALLRGQLTQLESKVDDLGDLDLDMEIGDTASEIQRLVQALGEVEANVSTLSDDIAEAAAELDGTTVDINNPDGSIGDGDSGNDPPTRVTVGSGFDRIAQQMSADGGDDGPTLNMRQIQSRLGSLFEQDIEGLIGDQDLNWSGQNFEPYARGRDIHLSDSDRPDGWRDRLFGDFGFGTEPRSMNIRRQGGLTDTELSDVRNQNIGFPDFLRDDDGMSSFSDLLKRFKNSEFQKGNFRGIDRMKDSLSRLIPSMQTWYSLIAGILPVLIAMGVQALGVAAALGAVAAAGAAVIGLGLIGHGSDMASSFQQAREELSDFGEELYEVFEPAMQQFAPIQAQFMDWAPDQLSGVADAMEGLTAYEGTFYEMFSMLTQGAEGFFTAISENEETLSQLATRFLQLGMSGLGDFLSFLVDEADENQQMLIDLAGEFKNLLAILYNVSKAFSAMVVTLGPVIDLFTWFSGLLNNQLMRGILTFTVVTAGLTVALSKMGAAALFALSRLGILGGGTFIGSVVGGLASIHGQVAALIAQYTSLAGAAASAAAAIAMTGIGALAVGAGTIAAGSVMSRDYGATGDGYSGGGSGSTPGTAGSGGQVYNDNRQYTINNNGGSGDYAREKALESTIRGYNETNSAQEPPSPGANNDGENN